MSLKSDGSLWAWGYNGDGRLGDGTTSNRNTPVQVDTGFTAIAAGRLHSVALKSEGSVWAWGYNGDGRLGDGATSNRHTPVQVGTGFAAIAAGDYHTVALKSDGSVWAWGNNDSGRLGDGTETTRSTPVAIGLNLDTTPSSSTAAASISTNQPAYTVNSSEQIKLSGSVKAGGYAGTPVDIYVRAQLNDTAPVYYLGATQQWTTGVGPLFRGFALADASATDFYATAVKGLPSGTITFGVDVVRSGANPSSTPDTLASGSTTITIISDLVVSGNVVKGPVTGASVNFYALNSDGSRGPLIGSGSTDSDGRYTTALTSAPTTPILAEATGGSHVNEVSNARETLSSTDRLTAVLPAGTQEAAITPLTHMAAARARVMAASGTSLATAVRAANAGVAQQYNLIDILGVLPVAANDAAQMATASREQRNYGVVLAGIAQQAASLEVRPIDLAAALASDMADGVLDGLGEELYGSSPGNRFAATVVRVPTTYRGIITLPPGAGTAALQSAIDTFVASKNNLTNLAGKAISIQPVNINPAGTDFFITATALPAWTEGRPGTATLTANGGTPPYAWAVTPGSALPGWLTLGPTGVLTGEPPLLAGGSTMSISPPFSITVTDSSVPAQAQAIQLTVSIVKAPPKIEAVPGTCIAGTPLPTNRPLTIVKASGGVPPYYFRSPSLASGAPPFGTSVWTDGSLRGTCPRVPGVYAFSVIGIDSIGADPPETTTLTAVEYSISPTAAAHTSQGGSGSIAISGTGSVNWTATSNASWISIISGSTGSGNGTTSYSVSANTAASSRTGTLTIAGKTFTVTQSGFTCSFAITPTSISHTSSGGAGSVAVTSSSGCSWTAASTASWISITSGASGSGAGTTGYSVSANTSTSSRTGTLTVAGKTFTVSQSGVSCSYSINPTSASAASTGGTGSIAVTTSSGCSWTAASNASWITLTSGSSGSGSGTISYSASSNGGTSSRSGTISVQGQTFTVTQSSAAPPACTYTYSAWSACQSNSTQTRTVVSSSPTGCVGTPTLSQACTYTPPPVALDGSISIKCTKTSEYFSPTYGIVLYEYYDVALTGTASGPVGTTFKGMPPTCDSWGYGCVRDGNEPSTTTWRTSQFLTVATTDLNRAIYDGKSTFDLIVYDPSPNANPSTKILLLKDTKICP